MNIDRKPRTTRLLMAIPAIALAIGLAACSGGGSSRPSTDQVADGLYKVLHDGAGSTNFTKDVAKCVAKDLVASKLSDTTLNYIAKGEDKQSNEADKTLTTQIVQQSLPTCMGK
ncbi:hypothetical protein [Microbacterium panaciterrae]|uniref:DUF732 domain-containing protein n=1 Tax=Microbacterium panaciterrae TaxID=985759 RepID=A0ABP8PGN0_9MICO